MLLWPPCDKNMIVSWLIKEIVDCWYLAADWLDSRIWRRAGCSAAEACSRKISGCCYSFAHHCSLLINCRSSRSPAVHQPYWNRFFQSNSSSRNCCSLLQFRSCSYPATKELIINMFEFLFLWFLTTCECCCCWGCSCCCYLPPLLYYCAFSSWYLLYASW